MKVRFQADADFNHVILSATVRREPGVDFQTATAAGMEGLQDQDVLRVAAREGRVLVTHDRRTMPGHFLDFIQNETSSGLLIVSQKLAISAAVEDLILIWFATEAEEWKNQSWSLPI